MQGQLGTPTTFAATMPPGAAELLGPQPNWHMPANRIVPLLAHRP